eukprot:scaffold1562_cov146-Isochrysis_galbana.AAC.1
MCHTRGGEGVLGRVGDGIATLTRDAEGEGSGRRDVPEVGTHAEKNKGGGGGDVFVESEGCGRARRERTT